VTFANSSTLALSTSEDKSNTSAMMNFINMSTCCLMLFLNEALTINAYILLPANFFILGIVQCVFWFILKKDPHFQKTI
jgi:hypothetical protein